MSDALPPPPRHVPGAQPGTATCAVSADDVAGCRAVLQARDPALALAAMVAPRPARAAVTVVLAFGLELARTRQVTREPIMGQIRLTWWHEALQAAADDRAAPPPHHEVLSPLAALLRAGRVPLPPLLAQIETWMAALDPNPHEDLQAFQDFAVAAPGAALALVAQLCQAPPAARALVPDLAAAATLVAQMRSWPADWAEGRSLLPAEPFAMVGLEGARRYDRRTGPDHVRALATLGASVQARLEPLARAAPLRRRAALPLLAVATQAHAQMQRLQRAGWDPARVPPLSLAPAAALRVLRQRWLGV